MLFENNCRKSLQVNDRSASDISKVAEAELMVFKFSCMLLILIGI